MATVVVPKSASMPIIRRGWLSVGLLIAENKIARENGIDLDSYGRKAISDDFAEFDYIIAMDQNNFADMRRLDGSSKKDAAKLYLMRDFDEIGKGQDVPDPYYGGDEGFNYVFELLDRSCRNLIEKIREENKLH